MTRNVNPLPGFYMIRKFIVYHDSIRMKKKSIYLIDDFDFVCPEVFCKKRVLRDFAKFTGKHGLQPATILKKRLQ